MVKYVKKNLDTANKFCQSLGPSLYRGSTVPRKVTTHLCHFRDFIFTMPDQVRNTYAELSYKLGNEEGIGGRAGELSFYLGRRQWHQSPTKWSEGAALTGK